MIKFDMKAMYQSVKLLTVELQTVSRLYIRSEETDCRHNIIFSHGDRFFLRVRDWMYL